MASVVLHTGFSVFNVGNANKRKTQLDESKMRLNLATTVQSKELVR